MSHCKLLPSAVLGFPSVISTSSCLISHPCHWFDHSHRLGYFNLDPAYFTRNVVSRNIVPLINGHETMHGVDVSGLEVTVCLRIIQLLNIVRALTGISLSEVAHVLCV